MKRWWLLACCCVLCVGLLLVFIGVASAGRERAVAAGAQVFPSARPGGHPRLPPAALARVRRLLGPTARKAPTEPCAVEGSGCVVGCVVPVAAVLTPGGPARCGAAGTPRPCTELIAQPTSPPDAAGPAPFCKPGNAEATHLQRRSPTPTPRH
ncbi:MAG: hypothetical protein ACLQBB_05590 [Solirubrobacteraceae bacterium]